MMNLRFFPRGAAAAITFGAVLLTAPAVHAQVTFNGTTAGAPTWNRPLLGNEPTTVFGGLSGSGSAVRYQSTAFYVNVTGNYNFLMTSTFDNTLYLYSSAFIPTSPSTNFVFGADDFSGTNAGVASFALTANTQYFFVATAFFNADSGAYTGNIGTVTRPVNSVITLGLLGGGSAAPEPTSLALMGLTALPVAGAILRRRRK